MKVHRIQNDQLYHYYRGDPLELQVLKRDSSRDKVLIGRNLPSRKRVQFFIPGNTFRRARVIGQRR
jgi:predicted cupin superfamily sugar epimerase